MNAHFAGQLNRWMVGFSHMMSDRVPVIISETANEYYRESFNTKSFGGVAWRKAKKKKSRGSLMVTTGALVNSIRPSIVKADQVRMSAGNSKVKYARIHNEGGVIERAARTETFVRNRYTRGRKGAMFGGMGAFKRGTSRGQGQSYKAFKIIIPARPFMGHSQELNKRIINRIKADFNRR